MAMGNSAHQDYGTDRRSDDVPRTSEHLPRCARVHRAFSASSRRNDFERHHAHPEFPLVRKEKDAFQQTLR
jgi:hypothetical protein